MWAFCIESLAAALAGMNRLQSADSIICSFSDDSPSWIFNSVPDYQLNSSPPKIKQLNKCLFLPIKMLLDKLDIL